MPSQPSSSAQAPSFVPGIDFLQGLIKSATAGLPGVGQWVAPTLDPDALGKRIDELRTVQLWLEANTKLLSATLQALEVQRMTLTTLKGMKVPLAGLAEALKAPPGAAAPGAAATPAVDPMQWWGALTQQFSDIAAQAVATPAPQPPGQEAARKKAPRAAPRKRTR